MNQQNSNTTRNNVEWSEAIVKWTRYDYVAMYDYPTLKNSEQVMQVYSGDAVQISKRYRREDWCLVQIGHVLGWVYLQDVRFITRGSRPPRAKTRPPQSRVSRHIVPDVNEVETASMSYENFESIEDTRPASEETVLKPGTGELENPMPVHETKNKLSTIQKLIGFFKR